MSSASARCHGVNEVQLGRSEGNGPGRFKTEAVLFEWWEWKCHWLRERINAYGAAFKTTCGAQRLGPQTSRHQSHGLGHPPGVDKKHLTAVVDVHVGTKSYSSLWFVVIDLTSIIMWLMCWGDGCAVVVDRRIAKSLMDRSSTNIQYNI